MLDTDQNTISDMIVSLSAQSLRVYRARIAAPVTRRIIVSD